MFSWYLRPIGFLVRRRELQADTRNINTSAGSNVLTMLVSSSGTFITHVWVQWNDRKAVTTATTGLGHCKASSRSPPTSDICLARASITVTSGQTSLEQNGERWELRARHPWTTCPWGPDDSAIKKPFKKALPKGRRAHVHASQRFFLRMLTEHLLRAQRWEYLPWASSRLRNRDRKQSVKRQQREALVCPGRAYREVTEGSQRRRLLSWGVVTRRRCGFGVLHSLFPPPDAFSVTSFLLSICS